MQQPYSVSEIKTVEKAYRLNDRGRVLKRSLRPDEYSIRSNGEPCVPWLVVERLKNEAACISFIQHNINIPVPKLLGTSEENGCFHLWMEFVHDIEMSELIAEQKSKVLPQGGPTGILAPPSTVYFHGFSDFKRQVSGKEEFVFCHCDLSRNNILVDPETLQIVAVIDWEYGGFFPQSHELPYYESSEFSGVQVKSTKLKAAVDTSI